MDTGSHSNQCALAGSPWQTACPHLKCKDKSLGLQGCSFKAWTCKALWCLAKSWKSPELSQFLPLWGNALDLSCLGLSFMFISRHLLTMCEHHASLVFQNSTFQWMGWSQLQTLSYNCIYKPNVKITSVLLMFYFINCGLSSLLQHI